ncbi:hypothetical protein RYX36_030899 [Vicia faba]
MISLRQLIITSKQSDLSENEFASLNHLRILGFHYCQNLKYLFKYNQLQSLETLFVISCGILELPLYMFPNLQTLYISDCNNLHLSAYSRKSVQTLKMKYLHLEGFPELSTLPDWIASAKDTLETLIIVNCPNLKKFPKWLINMSHLKRLYISECRLLSRIVLPGHMFYLTALENLHIDGCPDLYRQYQPQCGVHWYEIAHIKSVYIGEPRGEEE